MSSVQSTPAVPGLSCRDSKGKLSEVGGANIIMELPFVNVSSVLFF